VDLFAGAGGESTGIIQALEGQKYDLAAVNHWDIAIETHKHNHPEARHFLTSLERLNPHEVFRPTDRIDLLWASPECTHHSVARGGRPRSEQSRASAFLVLKWLSEFYVRRVILENVPEFVSWGPIGADGQPLKSKKGATFNAFVSSLQSMGYDVDWQILRAADYGDPTTRRRFFLQAVRGRDKVRWPEPTHAETSGLFGEQPWIPASSIIDWSIRGESIINRKRPLAEATLRRIEAGIQRYWGEWAEPFLVLLRGASNVRDVNSPLPTVTAGGGHVGLVQPFLYQITHGGRPYPADAPLPTVTTAHRGEIGVVEPFMVPFYGERSGQDPRTHGTGEPVPTIPASGGGKFGLVEPFILSQFGGAIGREVRKPMRTITTTSRGMGLLEPFIIQYYGNGEAQPLRIPLRTVTTKDRFGLVEAYGLDITFRMLQPHELAAAQGFPNDYWFAGTKTEQVKQIGNAVPVNTARALAREALSA